MLFLDLLSGIIMISYIYIYEFIASDKNKLTSFTNVSTAKIVLSVFLLNIFLSLSQREMTFIQRRINVDTTS